MATAKIPVDLKNPGQVFACMGLLEAANILSGHAECCFSWKDKSEFILRTSESVDPVVKIFNFLLYAKISIAVPSNWTEKNKANKEQEVIPCFLTPQPSERALPIFLHGKCGRSLFLSHWSDEARQDNFKLYGGNRSADKVYSDMLKDFVDMYSKDKEKFDSDPFNQGVAVDGTFRMDMRKDWVAIDIGYSPDIQGKRVIGFPIVELLAPIGLEFARPIRHNRTSYSYQVWSEMLDPMLARACIGAVIPGIKIRKFNVKLGEPTKFERSIHQIEEETTT